MPLFKYKVADRAGAVSETVVEGESREDSLSRLRARGLTPLDFLGQAGQDGGGPGPFSGGRLDVVDFTNRLAPLLKAQIQLERALGIIADGLDAPAPKRMVSELRRGLHEGRSFSSLIKNNGTRFPKIYSALVEAGEETGSLPDVMQELRRHLNARKELSDFLITSSIYPAVILAVVSVVITLLFTVFIPKFARIFADSGRPLPLPTKVMLAISSFAASYWPAILIAGTVTALAAWRFRNHPAFKDFVERLSLELPLVRDLVSLTEISRYLRTLSILVGSHVHLLDAVAISSKVLSNGAIAASLSSVPSDLRGGAKLSAALSRSPHIPKLAAQMLAIGEESGRMGEMLDNVASHFEERLRIKVKRLLALFEPAVILVLSLLVLAVVVSIFMAILEMNKF